MPKRTQLPPFAALKAFDAYGHQGGVRSAARYLEVDPAIVSRHLRNLEQFLGTALIHRRSGELTEYGREYFTTISAALQSIEDSTAALTEASKRPLRIWCIPGLAYHWLSTRLRTFNERNQGVLVELRPSDSPADLSTGEIDGDIRFVAEGEDPPGHGQVNVSELAAPREFPVAAPSLGLKAAKVSDLLDLPLLHEANDLEWRIWFAAQGLEVTHVPCAMRLWHAHLTLAAARAGQGVALVNEFLVRDDLENGALEPITCTDETIRPHAIGRYVLLTSKRRIDKPAARLFERWLQREAQAYQQFPVYG